MSTLSPINKLQERCVKCSYPFHYKFNVVQTELGLEHEAYLYVNDDCCKGRGRTKVQAKENAANMMLEYLGTEEIVDKNVVDVEYKVKMKMVKRTLEHRGTVYVIVAPDENILDNIVTSLLRDQL